MHNPKSVLENEMHKLIWDFEIQTDYLIAAQRRDLIITTRKTELAELWTLLSRLITE